MQNTQKSQCIMESPAGPVYLTATAKGLVGIHWRPQLAPIAQDLATDNAVDAVLAECAAQLREYFDGKRTQFDLPLDMQGTAFQRCVWDELSQIPYGQTISYRELARLVKNDGACRAVGTANGRNPISIVVPCHRVISSDGTLGGYSGGLDVKSRLLNLETRRFAGVAALDPRLRA